MKKFLLFCSTLLAVGPLSTADLNESITAAAKNLSEQANYSRKSTVVVPHDAPFHPRPTEGKIEKDGCICVKSSFGDNTVETVMKGDKAVFTNPDGEWQPPEEASQ